MNDTLKAELQAVADKGFTFTAILPEVPEIPAIPAVPAETVEFKPTV